MKNKKTKKGFQTDLLITSLLLVIVILLAIIITPVTAEEYCSFINITQGQPGLDNMTANMTAGPQGEQGLPGTTSHNLLVNLTYDDHLQYLLTSGLRVLTGKLDMGGFNISNASEPVAAQDVATKNYVDIKPVINNSYVTISNASYVLLSNGSYVQITNGSYVLITNTSYAKLVGGYIPTANLGSGSASSSTYLRGDQSWATPSGGSGGYTIFVQALTSSPGDSVSNYFGMKPGALVTNAGRDKVYIRKAGAITGVEVYQYSGTAGTAEAYSLYIAKNGATSLNYLVQTVSAATSERIFTNWSMSVPMVPGDYFEMQFVNPAWATNPLTTITGGYVYLE